MIATSEGLAKWSLHAFGEVPLVCDLKLGILQKAAEFNKRGKEIVSTFGHDNLPPR